MRAILNLIWFLFAGLWLALGYMVAGIICCALIITIPFGLAAFRMARYVLWPFGRAVIRRPGAGAGSLLLNIIWFVLCGWWLAIGHVLAAIAQTLTIVGVVNAVVSLKMIPVTCFPFGKQIVSRADLPLHRRPLHSI
ncbi:YccF domain-containing protein [Arachnia propionica]|uniref:YccF domain-containing protein n=1 Tax=Arachnia propionica TaxID=1750 RepID=A0A3P1WU51_9ACTN|nr:YccF domain-containing protein [Arachnia propionica]RRD49711.1 YccF domain-containing protein [Arachnia propionica]